MEGITGKSVGSKFAFGIQSDYEIAIAYTDTVKFLSANFKSEPVWEEDEQMCDGADFQGSDLKGYTASGEASFNLPFQGFEKLFKGAMGAVNKVGDKFTFTPTDELEDIFTFAIDKKTSIHEAVGMKILSFGIASEAMKRLIFRFSAGGNRVDIPATVNTAITTSFVDVPYVNATDSRVSVWKTACNGGALLGANILPVNETDGIMQYQKIDVLHSDGTWGVYKVTNIAGLDLTITPVLVKDVSDTADIWAIVDCASYDFSCEEAMKSDLASHGEQYVLEAEREGKRELTGTVNLVKYRTDRYNAFLKNVTYLPIRIRAQSSAGGFLYSFIWSMPNCLVRDFDRPIEGSGFISSAIPFKAYKRSSDDLFKVEMVNQSLWTP